MLHGTGAPRGGGAMARPACGAVVGMEEVVVEGLEVVSLELLD